MKFILIGLKGSGKSTLGKSVAKALQKDFLDTDTLLEENYFNEKKTKYNFKEIYELEGADKFKEYEAKAYNDALKSNKAIISCGGSLPLNENIKFDDNREDVIILYIYVEKETLRERLREKEIPAFFDPDDFDGSFDKMWKERDSSYRSICDYIFDNSADNLEQAQARFYNRIISEVMNKKIVLNTD